jgi:hypothetical protein
LAFKGNVFWGSVQIGEEKGTSKDRRSVKMSSLILENNAFRDSLNIQNGELNNLNFYDNYIKYLTISDLKVNADSYVQKTVCEGRFNLDLCLFKGALAFNICHFFNNLVFDQNLFFKSVDFESCALFGRYDQRDGLLNNNRFYHKIAFNKSIIHALYFINPHFKADSSAFVVRQSRIGFIGMNATLSRPYVIDLSNNKIEENGRVLLNRQEGLYTVVGLETKNENEKSILYLDGTDVDKITFNYDFFKLASIEYDPYIYTSVTSTYMRFHPAIYNVKIEIDGKKVRARPPREMMTQNVVKAGIEPPYTYSQWQIKVREAIERKDDLFKRVLKKFSDENNTNSLVNLSIEYEEFKLLELQPKSFNTFKYWINKYWWNFGYSKEWIYLWTIFLFFLFSVINYPFINWFNSNIYQMENLSERLRTDELELASYKSRILRKISANNAQMPRSFFRKLISRPLWRNMSLKVYRVIFAPLKKMLISCLYTGFLFFGLKVNADKLIVKNIGGTIWIIVVFLSGLICMGFIVNLIVK